MYAKIIDNNIVYSTNPVMGNGRWILNPTIKDLRDLGYKEVVHNYLPEKEGFYQIIDNYVETDVITVNYKYESEEVMPELTPEEIQININNNKNRFLKDFVITPYGCIRKETKIGSFISVLPNITMMVQAQGKCPANMFVLYPEPDYSKNEQCTNKWLITNQFSNKEMTLAEYNQFVMTVANEYQKLFRGV